MAKQMSYEQVVQLAAKIGAESAQKKFDALVKKDENERKDNRLRNTKLLLKNYRLFKASSQNAVYKLEDCEESAYDILSLMSDSAFRRAESVVESVKNSAIRTIILVNHIDAMLATYEAMCFRSGKPEIERRYRVIKAMYIDEDGKYPEEIADEEKIDKRTVYKDVDAGAEVLAALFFGADCLRSVKNED